MKVLHFEDTMEKAMAIRGVLRSIGINDVVWEGNLEAGLEHLEEEAFDVVISDMYFPMHPGGSDGEDAGERVIEDLKKRNLNIPVIIISSVALRIPEAYQCIWYTDSRDWESELRNSLKELRRKNG